MNLLPKNSSFLFDQGSVATVGTFDGVHLGHQSLIRALRQKADDMGLPLVLVLFEPQPKEYFQKKQAPARLSSLRDKLCYLKDYRIDYVYCISFNTTLAQTTATDFAIHYLFRPLNLSYLLVGQDFKFGMNREGDVDLLSQLGSAYSCRVEVYPEFHCDGERVSSTRIRSALCAGDLEHAALLLGRTYSMCGRVISGDGLGRQWGIPTANMKLHRAVVPLRGVFAVQVQLRGETRYGVANIGRRPTVGGLQNRLEIHLFDFNDSIYGEWMQVFFLKRLRDEIQFKSVDALLTQIHQDIADAQSYTLKQIFLS